MTILAGYVPTMTEKAVVALMVGASVFAASYALLSVGRSVSRWLRRR